MSALPTGDTWDYVVIQGYSTESTSIRNDEFDTDLANLYREVRDHSSGRGAGVTPILYQTWARTYGHSFYSGSTKVFDNPTDMQAQVREGYASALAAVQNAGSSDAEIGLVGDAFEGLDFDRSLYDNDLYHASTKGSVLAGLILYGTICDEDVSDISYAQAVAFNIYSGGEANWQQITAAADEVIAVPEPGTLALSLGAAVLLLRRRHPNRRR